MNTRIHPVTRVCASRVPTSLVAIVVALGVTASRADFVEDVSQQTRTVVVVQDESRMTDVYGDLQLTLLPGGNDALRNDGINTELRVHGTVRHNGSEIFTARNNSTKFFGAVGGAGPYTGSGDVQMAGTFTPGNSPAIVNFGGNLTLGPFSTLIMEIGGTTPGLQHDRINVAGTFTVAGTLKIVLINGFVPSPGDSFDLFNAAQIAGNFATIVAPPEFAGFDFSNILTTGTLSISAVPEASPLLFGTILMFGAALIGLRKPGLRFAGKKLKGSRETFQTVVAGDDQLTHEGVSNGT